MHCIGCGVTLTDTTRFCLSCGTDLGGDDLAGQPQAPNNTGKRIGNSLAAFGIAVVILTGIFSPVAVGTGFSMGFLLFIVGWLAIAGFGFFHKWSFTNALGGGFLAAIGLLFSTQVIWNSSDPAAGIQVVPRAHHARATAIASRTKTLEDWAQTIRRNSTPEQVIQLIGRPSSTLDSGTDMETGSKRLLIYEYPGLAKDKDTGRLGSLRIFFSSGFASKIQGGHSGEKIELQM